MWLRVVHQKRVSQRFDIPGKCNLKHKWILVDSHLSSIRSDEFTVAVDLRCPAFEQDLRLIGSVAMRGKMPFGSTMLVCVRCRGFGRKLLKRTDWDEPATSVVA